MDKIIELIARGVRATGSFTFDFHKFVNKVSSTT